MTGARPSSPTPTSPTHADWSIIERRGGIRTHGALRLDLFQGGRSPEYPCGFTGCTGPRAAPLRYATVVNIDNIGRRHVNKHKGIKLRHKKGRAGQPVRASRATGRPCMTGAPAARSRGLRSGRWLTRSSGGCCGRRTWSAARSSSRAPERSVRSLTSSLRRGAGYHLNRGSSLQAEPSRLRERPAGARAARPRGAQVGDIRRGDIQRLVNRMVAEGLLAPESGMC